MNKKAIFIKIIATILQIAPVLVALFVWCGPVIVSRADKVISVSAIVAIIIICIALKDAVRRFYQTPSLWKFAIVIFAFSLIAYSLGEQLLILSAVTLLGSIVTIPLNMWYNYLVRPVTAEELKDMVKK